ncbi:MAG: hypothetical protein A3A33_03435 [Candidatus Yanofskybacteria bacterium RIFCSPLOWO2_01_FULL_49_25]|uniref:ParB-like N-terminal domain-containing protein n=1 Tax=Candidatus Yanofskybacteria bacterium RIFCSPLOWO2_01_FULL_49_25 TaxID=1802701 RepID=A0A1F8GTQ2_9BACT|nr:MAG: hypothetical protein A3A33_03435 [Candidatus Yanofskybacteria bacterium RIFCSPLOWO2_01_FULL_49_25]
MKKQSGLGRGLQSLIPNKPTKLIPKEKTDNIFYIQTAKVRPNPNQPRQDFDPSALKELADSIKKYGVLQPLLVSKIELESPRGLDVSYELIAGERRLRAAKLAGLPEVPVIIKDNIDEGKMKLEVALIENLQREDLNPIEEAEAFASLASEFKLTQKEIADRVGKSRESVANGMRLLGLAPNIKEGLRAGKISKTHARALLAFEDDSKRQEVFKQILAGSFAARDVEHSARDHKVNKNNLAQQAINTRFVDLQNNLAKNLSAPVLIRSGAAGGRIEIRFATLEDLNKIVKVILD